MRQLIATNLLIRLTTVCPGWPLSAAQERLADALGLDIELVQRIMDCTVSVNIDDLSAFALVLGCTLQDLLRPSTN